MSIRTKFFALAGILLLLFGAVVGILTLLQNATAHRLANIVSHHQPLRRLLADLDVDTFEYELRIDRLLLQPNTTPTEQRTEAASIDQVGDRIRQNFDTLHRSLDAAVAYNHSDPENLHALAILQGSLPFIERQVEPFLALGRQVTDALLAARSDDVRTLVLGFARYEDAFGPDLRRVRESLANLTEQAAAGIHPEENLDTWVSFTPSWQRRSQDRSTADSVTEMAQPLVNSARASPMRRGRDPGLAGEGNIALPPSQKNSLAGVTTLRSAAAIDARFSFASTASVVAPDGRAPRSPGSVRRRDRACPLCQLVCATCAAGLLACP